MESRWNAGAAGVAEDTPLKAGIAVTPIRAVKSGQVVADGVGTRQTGRAGRRAEVNQKNRTVIYIAGVGVLDTQNDVSIGEGVSGGAGDRASGQSASEGQQGYPRGGLACRHSGY